MKFRNKETGKIRDFEFVAISKENDELIAKTVSLYTHHAPVLICRSIDQLNEEWEDYEPAEPLIKDEKIRKVVRLWADGNMATRVQYDAFWRGFRCEDSTITVWEELPLEDNKTYSIDELCGEEEE